MRRYAPHVLAFLGKRAFSVMIRRTDVGWARYPDRFAGSEVWILPNPSGLNRGFTLDGLVAAYAELRHAVTRDPLHLNVVERGMWLREGRHLGEQ